MWPSVVSFFHLSQGFHGVSFYCWIIFHCTDTPLFIYPLISSWASGSFPLLGCYEWCSYKHSHMKFCINVFLFLMGNTPSRGVVRSRGNSVFNISKNCSIWQSHQWCMRGPPVSNILPTLVIICCFHYYYRPNECDLLAHCGFDLHFPDG